MKIYNEHTGEERDLDDVIHPSSMLDDDFIETKISQKKLSEEKLDKWSFMLSLAKKYYSYYKNLDIKKGFVTLDGIHKSEVGFRLGLWIIEQRHQYIIGELPKDKYLALDSIGMNWGQKKSRWTERYDLVRKYYEENGNIDIDDNYVTEDGIYLGQWIKKQKSLKEQGKLLPEQVVLLELLGIEWINHRKR